MGAVRNNPKVNFRSPAIWASIVMVWPFYGVWADLVEDGIVFFRVGNWVGIVIIAYYIIINAVDAGAENGKQSGLERKFARLSVMQVKVLFDRGKIRGNFH